MCSTSRRGESRMPPSEIPADESRKEQCEQDLADFLDNAPVGLLWLAADGTILRTNRALLDLLAWSRAEQVGHRIGEFFADCEACDLMLQRFQKGDELRNYVIRLRSRD